MLGGTIPNSEIAELKNYWQISPQVTRRLVNVRQPPALTVSCILKTGQPPPLPSTAPMVPSLSALTINRPLPRTSMQLSLLTLATLAYQGWKSVNATVQEPELSIEAITPLSAYWPVNRQISKPSIF